MKPRHLDLEIPIDDPFLNCRLDRKKDAEIFTNIVNNYRDGCTIALTGRWGRGKTLTFNQHDFNGEQCVTILEKLDSDMNTSRIKLTALTSRIDLLYGKVIS